MKTLSIINLKGGVAKTISSVNMAHSGSNTRLQSPVNRQRQAGERQQDFEPPQLRP